MPKQKNTLKQDSQEQVADNELGFETKKSFFVRIRDKAKSLINFRNLIIAGVVVAVVILIGGGVYWWLSMADSQEKQVDQLSLIEDKDATQQKGKFKVTEAEDWKIREADGWKTYVDEKYNFEFDYLPEWTISPQDFEKNGQKFRTIGIDNPQIQSGDYEVWLTIKENVLLEGILQEEEDLRCHGSQVGLEGKIIECYYCSINESVITVAEHKGKKLTKINRVTQCKERGDCEDKCIDYGERTAIFQKDNNIYILSTSGGEQPLENFDQILATFKFIEDDEEMNEETKISYQLQNAILYYEKGEIGDQYVTVYISKDNINSKLIDKVPVGIAGGNFPEFKETSNSSVALLTVSDADMGGWRKYYYYIDAESENYLVIKNNNLGYFDNKGYLKITDFNNKVWKIGLAIKDDCGMNINRKVGMDAFLTDITLNDKNLNLLAESKILKCLEYDLGDKYNPEPQIEYLGISKDLSKVYFSLFDVSYIFDIGKELISKGDSSGDLLTNSN